MWMGVPSPSTFSPQTASYERFPALAAESVRRKPDIIVAYTTAGRLAAKRDVLLKSTQQFRTTRPVDLAEVAMSASSG